MMAKMNVNVIHKVKSHIKKELPNNYICKYYIRVSQYIRLPFLDDETASRCIACPMLDECFSMRGLGTKSGNNDITATGDVSASIKCDMAS